MTLKEDYFSARCIMIYSRYINVNNLNSNFQKQISIQVSFHLMPTALAATFVMKAQISVVQINDYSNNHIFQ